MNLGFKSEQKLVARWIAAYLIYGDLHAVCLVYSVSFRYIFWSLIQLSQNC